MYLPTYSHQSDMENNPEIIDLTQSFTYCRAPIFRLPPNLAHSVINLDDSFGIEAPTAPTAPPAEPIVSVSETDPLPAVNVSASSQLKKSTATKKKKRPRSSVVAESPVREKAPRLGDCPVCRDPLGTHPMASTKCGHVYCIKCIDQAVKIEKKCPTCRKPLKGATAFHPLFL